MYRRAVAHHQIAFERARWKLLHAKWLAISMNNVASMHWQLTENDEALRWYERAVNIRKQLAEDNPATPDLWESLFAAYQTIVDAQHRLKRPTEAARWQQLARAAMERIPREGPSNLCLLARARARCAEAVAWGKEELTNEEKAEQQRGVDLSVEALRQAAAAGLEDVKTAMDNKELAVLRSRPDYQALVAKVEASAQQAAMAKVQAAMAKVALQKKKAKADPENRQTQADLAASQRTLGMFFFGRGDSDGAIQAFQQALALRQRLVDAEPKNPIRHADLAATLIELGDVHWQLHHHREGSLHWQRAREVLETGITCVNKDTPEAEQVVSGWRNLGFAYVKAGLFSEAAACYDRVLKFDPLNTDVRIFHSCAVMRLHSGDIAGYRQTCQDWDKVHVNEMWMNGIWSSIWSGRSLEDPQKLVKRAEDFLAASDNPHFWQHVLALANYRAGRFKEALVHASMENQLSPFEAGSYTTYPVQAMAHHRLGETAKAREWLEKANQAVHRQNPLAQAIDAANVLPDQFSKHKDGAAWHTLLVLVAEANDLILGHRGEADCLDHLHQAYVRTKLGESKKAEEEFQAAVRGHDKDASAWLARGRVYLLLGDKDRARADFAKAHQLKPDDPQIQKEYEASGGKEKDGR